MSYASATLDIVGRLPEGNTDELKPTVPVTGPREECAWPGGRTSTLRRLVPPLRELALEPAVAGQSANPGGRADTGEEAGGDTDERRDGAQRLKVFCRGAHRSSPCIVRPQFHRVSCALRPGDDRTGVGPETGPEIVRTVYFRDGNLPRPFTRGAGVPVTDHRCLCPRYGSCREDHEGSCRQCPSLATTAAAGE